MPAAIDKCDDRSVIVRNDDRARPVKNKNNDRTRTYMTYPGGKGSSYQKIINLIPPHRVYIETHLGAGSVLKNKLPAKQNFGIDIDPQVCHMLATNVAYNEASACCSIVNSDAVCWLNSYHFVGDEFIYSDPPYVKSSRRSQRDLYRFEYTDQDHKKLLTLLKSLPCKIMISGYWSDLYDDMLVGWEVYKYQAQTRGGRMANEYLWMNYRPPNKLHDYRYLGENFRDRERIKRKKKRWAKKFEKMPILERQVILSALNDIISS